MRMPGNARQQGSDATAQHQKAYAQPRLSMAMVCKKGQVCCWGRSHL